MNIEEMQKEENFEHEVLDRLKCLTQIDFDYNAVDGSYVDAVLKARDVILTAYEKEKEKNKKLDKENQSLFELYNFNDTSLLAKILKDYKNLIEKQQKEIEELKNRNNKLMEELDLTTVYISGVYDGEKKVEDKIKAKIEEIKDGTYDAKIVLQSLLKEE